METNNLIKKLRENRAEISLNKYVDRLYETIKALEYIEGAVKEALDEGKTSFYVKDYYTIKISRKIFGCTNLIDFNYDWFKINITEIGLKRLNRELKKIYKKAGKKHGNDSSSSDQN